MENKDIDQEYLGLYIKNRLEKEKETWRYKFAGLAMQGLLMNEGIFGCTPEKVAQDALVQADALLAELEKGGASERK